MKGVIVPIDATVLVDGKHWTHHDMPSLDITGRLGERVPATTVKAVHFDGSGTAMIEWDRPAPLFITEAELQTLYGDVLEDHAAFFIQAEAEMENAIIDDEAQTYRIAEHENKLFDQRRG
jgi:hypothetical protein